MGIETDILGDWHAAYAALVWQQELGGFDPVGDAPLNRYELAEPVREPAAPAAAPRRSAAPAPEPVAAPRVDAVAEARRAAAAATTLEELRAAISAYGHCELKRGAKSTVFCDGLPQARVMVIGEAPGRDEDIEGRPFVGRAGQLLDRMFAAIGLRRDSADAATGLYITNVMPWRPPSNREPTAEEMAMMGPFLARHAALIDPEVIVVMGNTPAQAVLGSRGITRLRGSWAQAWGKPVLPMLHPAYLLRNPAAKREAWADLLALQARLRG
ncbi:uracil-DNA glycosylase [Gemmobacter fulvus]|uniref:Type-4 uracil-DNA glycosylase n=1 Tax=Gemmobacter fulvus TaxID=2840474 RepID=A0A975P8Q5_9RHOB|nr:uracil-DNA glycosylase [Gemmobacter fulvus]MBT9244607.1 uracil-DNA glycosylase [Gemmobacter fulvus]QWK91467.1 uracil-DNA glycosylase [Gemmobacter fulvus]